MSACKISHQSKTIGLEKIRLFCKAINRVGLEILEEKRTYVGLKMAFSSNPDKNTSKKKFYWKKCLIIYK